MITADGFTRRQVLTGGAALAAVVASGPTSAANHPLNARGTVRTPDGKAIENILVTNGIDVVKTDEFGRYSLQAVGDCVISVIKPSGYAPPKDPVTNIPRFCYVHQPLGSPPELKLAYAGIAPTGPLPDFVDFTLHPQSEADRYEAILFADPQPETHTEVDFIRDGVIPNLIGTQAAFGITLGDVVGDNLALYDRLNGIIGQIGLPWYNVPGNHDLNFEATDNTYARETWKRVFGPTHYAFYYGPTLFIMLNNVVYGGADSSGPLNESPYTDRITDEQLLFVENLLAFTPNDTLVIVGMHVPLKSKTGPDGREIAVGDCARLLEILGDRPSASMSGHTHMNEHRYIYRRDCNRPHHHQVLATVCGSWWSGPFDRRGIAIADACDGTPAGHYILAIDGLNYRTEFRPTNDSRERQARAVLCEVNKTSNGPTGPARLRGPSFSAYQTSDTELVVNVFHGGPNTHVVCSIDDGPAIEMQRQRRSDPFVAAVYAQNRSSIKPWVHAEQSTHIWAVPLPPRLKVGIHRLEIIAVGEFGQRCRDCMIFEITG